MTSQEDLLKIKPLIFQFPEPKRREALKNTINTHEKFTDTISYPDHQPDAMHLCLISFTPGMISGVSLSSHGKRRIISFSHRTRFDYFSPLIREISADDLFKDLPIKLLPDRPAIDIDARWWPTIRQRLIRADQGIEKPIERIEEIILNFEIDAPPHTLSIMAQQKDALGVALDIFGADRKAVFHSWRGADTDSFSSYLEGVDDSMTEDAAIAHDWGLFSEAWKLESTKALTRTFYKETSRSEDREKLVVTMANRTNLETVMGVDLIYYRELYDAFTIVQYKMMNTSGTQLVYYPNSDKNYAKEVECMRKISSLSEANPSTGIAQYRLTGDPCLFKFLPRFRLHPTDGELLDGKYVPLRYWEELLKDDRTLTREGNRRVRYGDIRRHFANSTFTKLVDDGWIGSNGLTSEALKELVAHCLEERSVVFAKHVKESRDSKSKIAT